jgi:hypothetical protein
MKKGLLRDRRGFIWFLPRTAKCGRWRSKLPASDSCGSRPTAHFSVRPDLATLRYLFRICDQGVQKRQQGVQLQPLSPADLFTQRACFPRIQTAHICTLLFLILIFVLSSIFYSFQQKKNKENNVSKREKFWELLPMEIGHFGTVGFASATGNALLIPNVKLRKINSPVEGKVIQLAVSSC